MTDKYITIDVNDIRVNEPLPVSLYVYLENRFVTFRAASSPVEKEAFDRLQFKAIKHLFIMEKDRAAWDGWVVQAATSSPAPLPEGTKTDLPQLREDANRKMLDIFQSAKGVPLDKAVATAIASSKRMVLDVMKFPYAAQSLAHLQTISRGTVDHSINVSILSVYLAMHMGYSHQGILQHIGAGAILHDIGKVRLQLEESDKPEEMERKRRRHPSEGAEFLRSMGNVPDEVLMIVEQHHEFYDGTGYPLGLRGSKIYDLAKIVCIANVFDEMVSDEIGTLAERQRKAVQRIDQKMYKKFDPQKLEKALKILRLGV